MAYACNPPANYRCRQSVSLLSGSLRRAPIPRLQRHSGRFCEHLVAGSKDLSEELFSPSRAIKYRPHRPHRLECGRLQVVCAVGMDYFHRPRRRPYHPQPTDSDRGVEWAGVLFCRLFWTSTCWRSVRSMFYELLRRLRWSPEMMGEAGIGVVPMPAPHFPAETWSRSAE
jgi:hypothetical protein